MRILVLTNLYPPHSYGGYERACAQVVERWRAEGHAVEVLTSDHAVDGVVAAMDPRVTRALDFYWRDHEVVSPSPWRRLRIERRNRVVVDATVERFAPDIVSVWNHGAMSYALLAEIRAHGLPLALVVADDWLCWGPDFDMWTRMFDAHGRAMRVLGDVVSAVVRVPTRYPDLASGAVPLYASDHLRQRVKESSRFAFPHEEVVPWGIDLDRFSLAPHETHDRVRRLVLVGRIDERKGVFTSVRALSHLDGMSLRLVGPATRDAESRLAAVVADAGVVDRVERALAAADDIEQYFRSGDVALFPSEWEEPFGLVGLEAMASGVPLVATGTGGSGEYLVDGENALVVPPADPVRLAAAIERLDADRALRGRLVRGGLETARRYGVATMAETLLDHHRSLCGAT